MPKQYFTHVETWVFDLDNTLYPPRARLFDQIEVRMTQFVMDALKVGRAEADRLFRLPAEIAPEPNKVLTPLPTGAVEAAFLERFHALCGAPAQ